MTSYKRYMRRFGSGAAAVLFGVALVAFSLVPNGKVQAALLTNRSITLSSNQISGVTSDANGVAYANGSYGNGSNTTESLTFKLGATSTPQGILLMYCTSPLPQTPCTNPTGMNVSGLTGTITSTGFATSNSWTVNTALDASATTTTDYFQSGNNCTGSNPGRTNCILLTNASVGSTLNSASLTVPIGGGGSGGTGYLTNPTNAGSYFVRVQTFSGTSFTKAQALDSGAVAFSIANSIEVDSAVQEALNFTVGTTAPGSAGTTCPNITGTAIVGLGTSSGGVYVLGTTPSYASSYWRLNTNSSNGVTVYYRGKSLTNAATTALATSNDFNPTGNTGVEKFGLTINSGDSSNYSFTNLTASTHYNSATAYSFDPTSITTPVPIASATAGTTVNCDTASMQYLGQASTTTQPGIYKTNIIYYAVPVY